MSWRTWRRLGDDCSKNRRRQDRVCTQLGTSILIPPRPLGYYMNTEMRIREMEARLLAPLARVRANEILHGQIEGSKDEVADKMDRINGAFNFYMKSKLVMSRIPHLPLHKAQGLAKQVKCKVNDLEYLIVDYVGRMEVKNYHGSSWDELY